MKTNLMSQCPLAASLVQKKPADTTEKVMDKVNDALKQHFRPEFLNRVDDIVVFHPLGAGELRRIAGIQLGYLRRRLADRDMGLELSEAALDVVAEAGFDPVYGARPLKRTLQRRVLDPLAMLVLRGEFREGDHVLIDAGPGELRFSKAEPSPVGAS